MRARANRDAQRRMAVLDPLKVVITNYPEGETDELDAVNNPEDESVGSRKVPFGRELWIERDDFMDGSSAQVLPIGSGARSADRATPTSSRATRSSRMQRQLVEAAPPMSPRRAAVTPPTAARPKATLHWVSAQHAVPAEVRLYGSLFVRPDPGADGDLLDDLDPDSGDDPDRLLAGAGCGRGARRRDRPVRAAGLLLRRSRLKARQTGLRPHGHAQGHLGSSPATGPTAVAVNPP